MALIPGLSRSASKAAKETGGPKLRHVGVAEGTVDQSTLDAVSPLFPDVRFERADESWPTLVPPHLDILIVNAQVSQLAEATQRVKDRRGATRIVVVLRDADLKSTRQLVRAGVADVLAYPVSQPALVLCLERLLAPPTVKVDRRRKPGQVVAFIKAGGGVGATSLAVQTATHLSSRGVAQVCLADLDVQFGVAGLYLDLPEAVTFGDLLNSGAELGSTPFETALATHPSGARLLAAPRSLIPLEAVSTNHVESLMAGLRRDFPLTILDLPSVWTAWTNQALTLADKIVLVTHLTVPHVNLVARQLHVLGTQKLDGKPLVLVCNGLSADHTASLPLKQAEKALNRTFDIVIPEDRRTMTAAINQGVEVRAVRRQTKLGKAIVALAGKVADGVPVGEPPRGKW